MYCVRVCLYREYCVLFYKNGIWDLMIKLDLIWSDHTVSICTLKWILNREKSSHCATKCCYLCKCNCNDYTLLCSLVNWSNRVCLAQFVSIEAFSIKRKFFYFITIIATRLCTCVESLWTMLLCIFSYHIICWVTGRKEHEFNYLYCPPLNTTIDYSDL